MGYDTLGSNGRRMRQSLPFALGLSKGRSKSETDYRLPAKGRQSRDAREAAFVARDDLAAVGDGGRRNHQVAFADLSPFRDQESPEAGVRPCRQEVEGEGGERQKYPFDESFGGGALRPAASMEPVPQLRGRNRGDGERS